MPETHYMVQIVVKDGEPSVSAHKDMPDGVFTIHGARSVPADPSGTVFRRIQVEQRAPETGAHVIGAQHEGPEI